MICTRSLLMWTLALNSSDPAERALPACSFQQLHYFRPTSARNFEKTTESQPGWALGPGGTRAAVSVTRVAAWPEKKNAAVDRGCQCGPWKPLGLGPVPSLRPRRTREYPVCVGDIVFKRGSALQRVVGVEEAHLHN